MDELEKTAIVEELSEMSNHKLRSKYFEVRERIATEEVQSMTTEEWRNSFISQHMELVIHEADKRDLLRRYIKQSFMSL